MWKTENYGSEFFSFFSCNLQDFKFQYENHKAFGARFLYWVDFKNSDLACFLGYLNQNEKLYEIKPPLDRHFRNAWMQFYFISISIKFKCQMKEVWNRCCFTIPFFLCKKCDVKLKRAAELKFETRILGILYCRNRTFVPLHFTKEI